MNTLNGKQRLWAKFGFTSLEDEEYKKRTTSVQLGFAVTLGGIAYTILYTYLGFAKLAIAVIAYVLTFLVNVSLLYFTKNYNVFKTLQLLAILILPVAAQLIVGGYINGSAIALAAFVSPVGALLYAETHTARLYFYSYVLLIIVAGVFEYYFMKPALMLPRGMIITFFVFNILATFFIIYFIIEGFLKKLDSLRDNLKANLVNLKAAQAQLVQSEKMASLGELTAGIAHEIQNPLNFVNNFAEVSRELVDELEEELRKGNLEDTLAIVADFKQNLEKINHHGKRADGIVKGMLQHSRAGGGQKEPTDLNKLTDEYLRLAYHGARAKDNSFNAELIISFDKNLPLVNIVPQDLGRALLNLFNNAFYAVQQKIKIKNPDYKAAVVVTTGLAALSSGGRAVEIVVKDNGTGIPEHIKDKIMQPFFTTKPTGEGTGLGLSLSYDIVVKGHGGSVEIESEEGNYTIFKVTIPV